MMSGRSLASWLTAVPAVLVALAPGLPAQTPDGDQELGERPERYAQIKFLEGGGTIRKGEVEEELSPGVPVAEGDVVESRGRGVLQLGDGTRVAFGPGTRLQVAALFADRTGDLEVLLRLDRGRLRIRVGASSAARVRVDTPAGTALLRSKDDASLEVGQDRSARLKVFGGRAAFSNERDRVEVRGGERLAVSGPQDNLGGLTDFNTFDRSGFEEWADALLRPRRGESAGRVPRELSYYADDLDEHGHWVYVEDCSTWCWQPMGVAAEWRPYYRGRWAAYPGGLTWVSEEPWGYVTYHHGRWGWSASLGWYWVPGVFYSPAWVAWHTTDVWFGWAPLGWHNRPCAWGYGAWRGGACWNVVNVHQINVVQVHTRVVEDAHVLASFNRGTGATAYTPAGGGAGPWFRGRMMVTPREFRDPAQVQRVVLQREVIRERVVAYDRQAQAATGRTIVRREAAPSQPAAPQRFEPEGPRPAPRPLFRESPRKPQPRGRGEGENPGGPIPPSRRPERSRREEPRPLVEDEAPRTEERRREDRSPAPARQDPFRERPRTDERRPDPPRREERRPDPPRQEERRPDPPRMEMRRPDPPRGESRPAPREHPAPAARETARDRR